MYPRTLILNPSGSGAFTFATLPVAALMSGEVAGVQAYTSDEGMCCWTGTTWESIGGASSLTAPTYAAARLLSGVNTGDRLKVLGRTTQSDGGQGLFTWVAGGSTTINDGSQLTAPGGIWQRPDVTINAQWYGIDPTGVAASDVALNLAIQDAIIQKKELVVPAGVFRLDAPLLLYPTPTWAFATLHMRGQGGTSQGGLQTALGGVQFPNGKAFPNTTFYANFIDKPAMICNSGRNTRLREFCVVGQNMMSGINVNPPYPPTSDVTQYVTGGCRDSRYSPYAGICFDPQTCNTPPDGGYPGFTYPVAAGALSSGSHDVVIENVFIGNFVVGVMINPGTANANGDDFTFRDVVVNCARIAYASGNTQARQIVIINGNVGNVQCAFDTLTYGNQVAPAFQVYGNNWGSVYNIINFFGSADAALLSGCYGESVVVLGRWGGASSTNGAPLVIDECHVQFWNPTPLKMPPVILLCGGPVTCIGCMFNYGINPIEAWNFTGTTSTATIIFEGCHFTGSVEAHRIPPIGVGRSLYWASFINCYINGAASGGQSQIISDVLPRTGGNSLTDYGSGISRLNATFQTRLVPDTSNRAEYAYVPPGAGVWNASTVNLGGSFSAMTLNATTVTFTKTNASQFFCENDILCWTMKPVFGSTLPASVPALKIPVGGISGNNVTANMLWDPAYYDTVANQPGAGTTVDLVVMQWAPTGTLTCTTNGTVNLTAVSPVNTLLPGDFVIGAGVNSADIPNVLGGNACRVVSNDGAGNAVLSKTATGSHTGVGLRFGYLSPVTPVTKTVATLPPGIPGLHYMVSDALTPAFGAAVAAGGAVTVPVFADNTGAWIVG